MHRVLLVEDDDTIAKIIQYYLSQSGQYEVIHARNAGEALAQSRNPVDVVLLDIMLPDVDGVSLCAKLRERIYCPIIFISCIDDEATVVNALEMGGDDYLTKPFNCKILQARIEANLRRVKMDTTQKPPSKQKYRGFTIDVDGHTIKKDGQSIALSPIEFDMLMYFVDQPNRVLSLDEIYECVWGKRSYGDLRTVIVHIYNLRKKIEASPTEPRYLKSMRGKGYFFDPEGK